MSSVEWFSFDVSVSPSTRGVLCLTEDSALVIEVKSTRQELEQDLKKLQRAEEMIVSEPDIMRGSPVYRGTRIPVQVVADMLSQGVTPEEIVEGYPSLDKEMVALAPFYVQAFPRRGRPVARPWANAKPLRVTRHRRSVAGRH